MTLYEINEQIDQILSNMEIDEETGEVLIDTTLLESLSLAKETKLENIACFIKNLDANMKALREEEKNLASRRKANERKAERLTNLLDYELQGNKFETARCVVKYRKSTATEVNDDIFFKKYKKNKKYCTAETTYKYNKNDLKKLIQAGEEIDGVKLIERNNISIK